MNLPLPLETQRLILRTFGASDLDAFQSYRSDPVVARYQSWTAPYPRPLAEAFIQEMLKTGQLLSVEWVQIAIESKTSGTLIGDCAVHLLEDDLQQAEIGFTLAQSCWGNGYMSEAVQALLKVLFDQAKIHRVQATCDVLNTASARLLERIGMRREGHFIENIFFKGSYGSEYRYAILAQEWALKDKN